MLRVSRVTAPHPHLFEAAHVAQRLEVRLHAAAEQRQYARIGRSQMAGDGTAAPRYTRPVARGIRVGYREI